MKLYVQHGRLNESGVPVETDVVKFSFGTPEVTGKELAWVKEMTKRKIGVKDKPSYRALALSEDTVIGWELASGNLTDICRSAQENWDVELKTVNSSTDKCDTRCRDAEGIECECACNYKNHGVGVGLGANEIVIGDLIIGTTYREVTRYFKKHEPPTWAERIAAIPSTDPGMEVTPAMYCEEFSERGVCLCGECPDGLN